MIAVPAGVRILVASKPVDFRRGADSLAALVREQLRHDPFSGMLFIFRAGRPVENFGVGHVRPGVVLEATGARDIPLATNHRRRDATERIADGCAGRRAGLVAAARDRRAASNCHVVRAATN